MIKIGFIGAGNMGGALAIAASKVENTKISIYDKDEEKAAALAKKANAELSSARAIACESDYVFIAVKPNIVPIVAEEIKEYITKNTCIVSMAAGVSIDSLKSYFGKDKKIIRIMPNTPATVGKGMMLFTLSSEVSEKEKCGFLNIMSESGDLDEIPEKLIDAASAVSGCGPAFVYMFIEAMADGAVECGLPRDKALTYAANTLIGASEMVKQTGIHPEELKDSVCSPGGSTIAGVHALDSASFRGTVAGAVIASYKKTLTLGK